MRRTLLTSVAALHLIVAAAHAAGEKPDGIAVTFVIDVRWSCGDDMPEFRTLAGQVLGSTGPQDYLEIITAHSGRPRLRLAQTIHRETLDQAAAAHRVLNDIHEDFLGGGNVSKALKMAQDRLENTCAKQGYKKAMVIILTDGHLQDSDAAAVLNLAEGFRKRNWPLYITGDSNTNKNLLIASNKDKIQWSALADAQPVLWLRQARAPLSKPENGLGEQAEEKRTYAIPSARRPPTTGESPRGGTPRLPIPTPEKPESTLPRDRITARSRTEVEMTFPRNPFPGIEPSRPSVPKGQSIAPTAPREPNRPTKTVEPADTTKKAVSPPRQPLWPRVKHLIARLWLWLIAGPCIVILAVAGYMISRDGRRARKILGTIGQIVKKHPKDDGMLIATINGLTRQLGRLSRLRPIYVGSGSGNMLRITEKGVSGRHLCLYQRTGKLMLQNLSKTPVMIRGLAVPPKGKRPLALPCVIELTDSVKLHLRVLQPNNSDTNQRSETHAQAE